MLEGLDQIDWASRNAEDVPQWIHQLASPDPKISGNASNHLWEQVIELNFENFGMGWGIDRILKTDVPVLIVPFLIEVLEIIFTREGTPTDEYEMTIDMLIGLSQYNELRFEGEIYHERMLKVREAVWEGIDLYKRILLGDNRWWVDQIVSLLCLYPEHADVVTPLVEHAMEVEKDTFAKQVMQERFDQMKAKLNTRE